LIAGPGKYICDKCTLVFMDELKFIWYEENSTFIFDNDFHHND
jgi:hypothetical protein